MVQAYEAGMRDFGENYVQEALVKQQSVELLPEANWHLIGSLQSNKIRQVVGRFGLLHGVTSLEMAKKISGCCVSLSIVQPILFEVQLDPLKHGLEPSQLSDTVKSAADLKGIEVLGIMGIPPLGNDAESSRPYFKKLFQLFNQLDLQHRKVLSMGMSGDFEVAITEGATHVRVGTAIFGQRS